MNTFHKILSVLAILIANSISASAIEFTVDGVRYSVNDDNTTVTVAGYPSGSKPTGDLTIPNSVISIGDYAFSDCSGLKRIDAYPDPEKVSIGLSVFDGVPKDGTLHVLPKYLSAYRTVSQWKDFTNIKGDLTEIGGIEVVRVDELDHTLPMNVYNMNGVKMGDRLEDLPAGIYIVRQGNKSAKVVK